MSDQFRADAALLRLLPRLVCLQCEGGDDPCDQCARLMVEEASDRYATGGVVRGPTPRLNLGGCCGFPRGATGRHPMVTDSHPTTVIVCADKDLSPPERGRLAGWIKEELARDR